MRIARILRLVTATLRDHLLRGLLIAGSCLISGPAMAQTLGDRELALVDAVAALFFDLEAGRVAPSGSDLVEKDRASRSIPFVDDAVVYRFGSPRTLNVFTFRVRQPCVVGVEHFSRDFTRQPYRRDTVTSLFDLGRKHTLELDMPRSTSGTASLKGDTVVCSADRATCRNDFAKSIALRGAAANNPREADAYAARMKSAVDIVRKLCPGRPR